MTDERPLSEVLRASLEAAGVEPEPEAVDDGRCASGCSDFVDDVCTVCGFVDVNFDGEEADAESAAVAIATQLQANAFAWFWAQVAIACLHQGYDVLAATLKHIGRLAADEKYAKARLGIDVSQRRKLGTIAWNVLKLSERGML